METLKFIGLMIAVIVLFGFGCWTAVHSNQEESDCVQFCRPRQYKVISSKCHCQTDSLGWEPKK